MDLAALKMALAASPENVPLLVMVAKACEDEFELEDAKEFWERVLSLEPHNAEAQMGVARLLDFDGKTSEAILRVEVLCAQNPAIGEAWILRARLALKEGDAGDAREFYERAMGLDAGLRDEDLLERIVRAGGNKASGNERKKRLVMTGDGQYVEKFEEDDPEEDDDGTEGMDAVMARELGLEFSKKGEVKFEDVGGMEAVKENIRMKIIYPIEKPELFKAYGKKAGGGVLMYGPPGCGKTLLAKATAGEIESNFLSVGLHQVLDMYIGQSEQKLHQIFELARKYAPTVLFFDEVDALAADRRDMRQSAGRGLINQLLAEMDGANGENEGVLILGATNAPWHLDSAFLRPGRFDRLLFVPPPDLEARKEVVRIHAREKPVVNLEEDVLAKKTDGFSGADLRAVFDQAVESTMEEAMKKGKVIPVTGKMLAKTAKQVKPSTRKWFESAKNYALYANQSGFYDEVLEFMGIKK
ncbi:AAA family ATPase [Roseibacillus persicicus]|uniref:AAA family ATPase n=1 Tax=Roseibacillus persicicus TaxID=454148 RepID=UPI00280D0921|nr:AAA family ATPase [Roseibacillus persicicus]MDQ8189558.1 AAA family ATPase [Roseibacillus persicicus]